MLLLTPPGQDRAAGAIPFATERDLLIAFAGRVRELDPDVLTGWNVVDFDLAVLLRLATRQGLRLELGRGPGAVAGARGRLGPRQSHRPASPGASSSTGSSSFAGAFVRMEDYSLDAVAREVLGEGKIIAGHGRADEILRLFQEDRARLVEYNRTDARLALEILEKLQLVELAVARSRLTGHAHRPRLARRSPRSTSSTWRSCTGGASWPPASSRPESRASMGGGHVLEPQPGLYRNVVVFDFRSLYPSLIRTFEIDPLEPAAPGLARFRRRRTPSAPRTAPLSAAGKGILPALLDELMPRREEAQRAGDSVKSHAIKILMNSFYGVLGHLGVSLLRSAARQRDHQLRTRGAALVQGAHRGVRAVASSMATRTACSSSPGEDDADGGPPIGGSHGPGA